MLNRIVLTAIALIIILTLLQLFIKISFWVFILLIIVLLAVLASTAASVALVSCDNPRVSSMLPQYVSKASVQTCLDSIVNPVFTNVNDVFELQKQLTSNAFIDSVFMSMPPDVLKNVSTVMIKKRPHCTKDDIVGEFLQRTNRRNIQIMGYDMVPKNEECVRNTVTEAPPTRVESQPAGSYKDTVIDGKRALIQH